MRRNATRTILGLTATLGLLALARTSAGQTAAGDLLIATRPSGSPAAIVQVNALGGQTLLTSFETAGTYASSLVERADGMLYAAVDDPAGDADAIVLVDPADGGRQTVVDRTTSGGLLDGPRGIDVDPATGDVIVVQGGQVLRADPTSGAVSVISEGGLLTSVREVAVDATGTFAYVVDDVAEAVVRVALAGGAQKRVVAADSGAGDRIAAPLDLVLDGAEAVAIAQTGAVTRARLSDGKGLDVARDPTSGGGVVGAAAGIDIDTGGSFVIVDTGRDRAVRVNPRGGSSVVSAGGLIVSPQDVIVVGGLSRSTGSGLGAGDSCAICGFTSNLTGEATAKVKGIAKNEQAMSVLLTFHPVEATWSANVDGRQLTGTYARANKKGTRARLTPDAASADALLAIVDQRLGPRDPPSPLLPSAAPKLTFVVNRKGTKGKLKLKLAVETDVGATTRKGALKTTLKGVPGG